MGYYYNTFQTSPQLDLIVPEEDDVVLTTSDGRNIILTEEQDEIEIESKLSLKKTSDEQYLLGQEQDEIKLCNQTFQLNYNQTFQANNDVKEPVIHSINVPFGKRFKIVLSDGTLVHLNSGSTFKYPVVFDNKKAREVFLKGEAFFDVAERKNQIFLSILNQ